MTREETASFIRAYLDGDTAVGNVIPIRDVLESAFTYLKEQPSLPESLEEAIDEYLDNDIDYYERMGVISIIKDTFKAGAGWQAGRGVSMEITNDTKWAEVDSFVHRNLGGANVIQIRKK